MGRKPKDLKDRKTENFVFKFPLDQPAEPGIKSNAEIMADVQNWCKREGKTFNEAVAQAIKEFDERHGSGNFQTLIGSFTPGGIRSAGQLEQAVVSLFLRLRKERGRGDIAKRDIFEQLNREGYAGNKAEAISRITRALIEAGIRVWQ